MVWQLSEVSLQHMAGVAPELVTVVQGALWLSPIDFGIPPFGGVRTIAEQQRLFQEGKTKCDGIKLKSLHQSGRALDFFAYMNGRASWEPCHLALIACAMLQAASERGIRIRWGGHFRPYRNNHGWDMPHIELAK